MGTEELRCAACGMPYEQARVSAEAAGVAFCMGGGSATGGRWLCWCCIRAELPGSDFQAEARQRAVLK